MKAYLRILVILSTLLLAAAPVASASKTIYVDADVGAGGDGSSWATAFKYLQDAFAMADVDDEIRVAQGTYVPDRSSANPDGSGDREATFELVGGVGIYGGYAGYGETDPNDRDIDAHETILSGDLLGNDIAPASPEDLLTEPTRNDNCYHVVTCTSMVMFETVVLDGLTIAGGHADGGEYPGPSGGGMAILNCTMMLTDCTFRDNCATYSGGGVYYRDFDPSSIISNCAFIGNSAQSGAGFFSHTGDSPPAPNVVDCVFADNFATDRGGGMFIDESYIAVKNCLFTRNTALAEGGAIFNDDAFAYLTNCMVSGNFAGRNGGGIASSQVRTWLTNCTIVGNEAGEKGGGMFDCIDWDRYVTNCILWDNRAYEGPQIAIDYQVNLIVRHSCLQGGLLDIHIERDSTVSWADGNNTDADPCFVDPGHWNVGAWVAGDYHLQWDSPCINAGDPGGNYSGQVDIDDEPRVMVGQVDMGADEVGEKQTDFTRNGRIDTEDLGVFVQSWLSSSDDIDWYILCDLYEDDGIDFADFAEFANDWLWRADWFEP